MTPTKTKVIVTFRQEGWHRWPEAPDDRRYLRDLHRHLFHFKVEVNVTHSDRQVEFHSLLRNAQALAPARAQNIASSKSCEQMAEQLFEDLVELSYAVTAVECWEDGECGARVEVKGDQSR